MTPLEVATKKLFDMGKQLSGVIQERDALRECGNTDTELIREMVEMLDRFTTVSCRCETCLQAKALINKARSTK